jgi:uncharacterized protein DUF5666
MTRKLVVLLSFALFASSAFAHGDEEHVIGKVTKVTQSSVIVQTTTNMSVEVMLTSDTKFTKGSATVTPRDLQVGDRVVIHAMPMKGGMLMAHTVQIGDVKTPPKPYRAGREGSVSI